MKIKRILFGQIEAPQLMLAPEGEGGGGDDVVDGEQPIDFSSLDDIPEPAPTKEAEVVERAEKGDKPEVVKPTPELDPQPKKETAKTKKKEEPSRTLKERSKEDAKAVEGQTLEETPQGEEPAKPETEKKPQAPPAPETIPTTEAELDAIKPKSENPKIKNDFDRLREAARQAITKRTELETQLEPLQKEVEELRTKVTAPPEELQKELEELRKFRQLHLLEDDPQLKAEFSTKLSAADENILNFLTKNLGLSPDKAEIMKKNGLDAYDEDWWSSQVLEHIANPLMRRRMEDALLAREGVKQEQAQRLEALRTDRDGMLQKRQEEQAGFWTNYSKGVETEVEKLAKDNPWAQRREAPAGATKEQIAEVEAHNKQFEQLSATFIDTVNKIATHDTTTVAHTVFKAMKLEQTERELAAVKAEAAEHVKRIEELENDIASATESGRVSHRSQAPIKTAEQKKTDASSEFTHRQMEGKEVSVDEAFEKFGL